MVMAGNEDTTEEREQVVYRKRRKQRFWVYDILKCQSSELRNTTRSRYKSDWTQTSFILS